MTAANKRPSYSSGASAFERSELDVAIEPETIMQIATADADGSAGPQANTTEISFGSFRLLPAQRLLLDGNKPIRLGSRALDVLVALVERPNELVSKEELMTRVWPKTFVHPTNLAVHMSALRRALRDGRNGNRFFINVPGRGYTFVAPIKAYGPTIPSHAISLTAPLHNSPAHVDRLIAEEPIPSRRVSHNGLVVIVGRGQSKQLQFDRRRRPLRAGPLHRPTTKATKYSLVTTS
jgi:DNA-binding winged helix-turn-helix (wHTH) protein